MSIVLVMLSHPLPPPSPFNFHLSQHQCLLSIRRPEYWSFSFSTSPSNEYSGLISFRMDWLDLLAVQGTLKSLLQHQSSKASILQRSVISHRALWFHICMCDKSLQSCPTLCDSIDCSPPGSSVRGILQARILEWVAMPSSRRSS